jgi:hypothetical protein
MFWKLDLLLSSVEGSETPILLGTLERYPVSESPFSSIKNSGQWTKSRNPHDGVLLNWHIYQIFFSISSWYIYKGNIFQKLVMLLSLNKSIIHSVMSVMSIIRSNSASHFRTGHYIFNTTSWIPWFANIIRVKGLNTYFNTNIKIKLE